MTGRHVIHTTVYDAFGDGLDNEHLNLNYTLLPAYLKNAANYSTHMLGKWHLGANTVNATPRGRGFDSHLGFYVGFEDHVNHTVCCVNKTVKMYDFTDDFIPQPDFQYKDSTPVFAARAIELLTAHAAGGPTAPPLFMYIAWQDTHVPLQAPADYVARFANATGGNAQRATLCAMAALLDEAVGNVTAAIKALGLADDTILILHSDNGGPVTGAWGGDLQSSNYPLRGGKWTLWQGGVRATALVVGPGVPAGALLDAHVHITDWLPSLVSMATGGEDFRKYAPPGEPAYELGDGIDVWATITGTAATPQREWVLLETGPNFPAFPLHGHGLIMGEMKLISVTNRSNNALADGWFAPPGQAIDLTPYSTKCGLPLRNGTVPVGTASCIKPIFCLFNLTEDPCEYTDIASQRPEVVQEMMAFLTEMSSTARSGAGGGLGCMPNILPFNFSDGAVGHYWSPCDI